MLHQCVLNSIELDFRESYALKCDSGSYFYKVEELREQGRICAGRKIYAFIFKAQLEHCQNNGEAFLLFYVLLTAHFYKRSKPISNRLFGSFGCYCNTTRPTFDIV